jgi:hypothetical protein
MQIEEYRKQHERFHEALNRELFHHYSGQKAEPAIARIYADYSDLFRIETIREIELEISRTPESFPSRRKSLTRIRAFAIEQFLDSRTCRTEQEIARAESTRSTLWEGRETAPSRIGLLLASEPDAARRRRLSDLLLKSLSDTRDLRLQRLDELRSSGSELGFSRPLDAISAGAGVDPRGISELAELVIAVTEETYRDRLGQSFSMSGLPAAEMRQCSAGYWEHRNRPENFFREDLLGAAIENTFSGMGLLPEKSGSVTVDVDNGPGRRPITACFPVRVPDEIRVLVFRMGGHHDYAALLHETGHAYHFAWTSANLAAEFRLTGDRGLCEAYGLLFEQLLWNENWLMEHLGFARPQAFLAFQALYLCYIVRREAGKLRFMIDLYGPGLQDAGKAYSEVMARYTGLQHDADAWTAEIGGGTDPAAYLRGWTFAAMLDEHLMAKFGSNWHRSPSAGRVLKEIWETGQLYTAEELSREIGLGPLDPHVLAQRLQQGLRR